MNVSIRPQLVSDAKRFFEILSNPDFIHFPVKLETIEEEKAFLRLNAEKRKNGSEFNFSVMYDHIHVGAVGVRIDGFRPFLGEIGYFVDQAYWGKGIATKAVTLLEAFIRSQLALCRLEIRMAKENKASQMVAVKCGYKKEGIMQQMLPVQDKWYDCYLYAKITAPCP